MTARILVSLTLGLALASTAFADDAKGPAPHAWKVGELTEVEFTSKQTTEESSTIADEEDRSTTSTQSIRMVFIDRIDEVNGGRVTRVTRHFRSVEVTREGRALTSRLQGRNVNLRRTSSGDLQASYVGGSPLAYLDLTVVEAAPWADTDAAWGLNLGSRDGTLANASTSDWTPPAEAPSFVAGAVRQFGLGTVAKGSWSIQLDPKAARVEGKVSLTGRETEETEEGEFVAELTEALAMTLVRRAPVVSKLPEGAAPPAEESEDSMPGDEDEVPEDDDMPGPDEGDDTPEDNGDDEDDMPVPDDGDDDDDAPLPDEDDDMPEDDDLPEDE